MKRLFALLCIATFALATSPSVHAQGSALKGVLDTADNLQKDIMDKQDPITTGPEDREAMTAPGKIDKDASRKFTETKSGLKYRVLRQSDGKKPTAADTVVAHYKGWLDNKRIFDSSYRRGRPIPFPLRGVIAGWTEGMQFVGVDGMIELDIPYQLGYGERGMPQAGIPPKARLHFVVELKEIK